MLFNRKIFKRCTRPRCWILIYILRQNECPENDVLCEESVWLMQNLLLAEKSDMDDIATSIERIHKNAEKIKKQK